VNARLPRTAGIVARTDETRDTFTLTLRLEGGAPYRFEPGQFNMLYLFGCGEVPISVVDADSDGLRHTVRAVGRVTRGLHALTVGDRIGLRGPYGRGWPLQAAAGHDLLIVTGGLGCAPSVSIVQHVLAHRERFGHLTIMQGVRHADDLIWRDRYAAWASLPDVDVRLAADVAAPGWGDHVGLVTELFDSVDLRPRTTFAMLCGPEVMMQASAAQLHHRGVAAKRIFLSMERNMHCGVGLCGHCQRGARFVCRDGPVFAWPELSELFGVRGY
jgi:NAD(P)H-flavin reductase